MNSLRSVRALRAPSRIAALKHSQIRQFHPTRPARLVNEALDAAAVVLHGVHSVTGLPWFASIPLTALIVRTVVGLPLQIFTRVNARREGDISPLVHSWRVYYLKQARRSETTDRKTAMEQVKKATQEKQRHLGKRWKVTPGYRYASALQLPVWLSLMESLRCMSGNTTGLASWVLSLLEPSKSPGDFLHMTVEPTLANEGALWFPDLLAGDPTATLPVLLSLSILLNVRTGWHTIPLPDMADMPDIQMYQATAFRGLRLFIQIMAVNAGAAAFFSQMPTALLIYWVTSTNIATLQTYLLGKYMFLRPPMETYKKQYIAFKKPGVSDPFRNKLK